ncbi:TlyA family RNA methyltransferase [Aureimonas sp. AU20]|uniref:TlyA family RNA methyltransferase n=1 Tax=Aureimonas sp. AU20 TaxID=1349819 RepID=UPI000785876F|nr:TlyA family RNA methyltransferase [Aureimonas sp. AU20]
MAPALSESRARLDVLMAEAGIAPSRARARDAILRGHVRVDGAVVTKPGQLVSPQATISQDDPASAYVSRAALKLVAGLDTFGLLVDGRTALDVGASTGGFTEVLLQRGARHVVAIDVGHDQMHPSLKDDPRVTCLEGLNARDLAREHLGGHAIDLVVCDVSFISMRLALPPALSLAESGADGVFLVKPQFEAGRAAIGKNGLLRDPSLGERIAADMATWLADEQGWPAHPPIPSPIEGGDGNREFLLVGRKA